MRNTIGAFSSRRRGQGNSVPARHDFIPSPNSLAQPVKTGAEEISLLRNKRLRLTLKAKIPGASQAVFADCAAKAKAGCPISKLFKAEIILDAALV